MSRNTLVLPLPNCLWSITRMPLTQQQVHTVVGQNALLLGKTLLVVPSTDSSGITLPHLAPTATAAAVCFSRPDEARIHHHSKGSPWQGGSRSVNCLDGVARRRPAFLSDRVIPYLLQPVFHATKPVHVFIPTSHSLFIIKRNQTCGKALNF